MDAIFVISFIIGLALALGLLLRARVRLRKQEDELRALSVLSQILRANLSLDSLLNMVYVQTSQLLDIDSFLVGLVDQGQVHYPLFIRYGVQEAPGSSDDPLLRHVMQTREPLMLNGDIEEAALRLGLTATRNAAQAWLGVPLMTGEQVLGVIAITSTMRPFGGDDLRLINIVAANTGIAIHNTQFYTQQTGRVRQMAALNNALSRLTGTLSPTDVLDTVISSATVIADATGVAVYMLKSDRTLVLVRSLGFSEAFAHEAPLPLVTDAQQPVIVNDVRNDEHAAALRPIMEREGKAASIELPLSVGGVYSGALGVYFDRPYPFSEEKIELLRTFATQVAQAMHNARLYTQTDEALERRVEQLETLAAVGNDLIATNHPQSIYELILSRALEATGASHGLIVMGDEQDAHVAAQHGYPPGTLQIAHEGITGRVLHSGQVVRSRDVREESDYVAMAVTTRAQLSVPLRRGQSILGAITLESDQANAFSDEDSQFVIQLANQMVIALDNTHLFRDVSEARDRLQVILDHMAEAIVLINPAGEIALANPRVDLLGLRAEDLRGQWVEDLLRRDDVGFAEKIGCPGIKTGLVEALYETHGTTTFTIEKQQRTLYLQRQVIPVRDEGAISILLVFRDETEQHELEVMREDLTQMIVHDLRSPLTAVSTGLKLLSDMVPADSELRPSVETTTEASQRAIRKLLSRVESLLDISKIERGQLTLEIGPTQLKGLVENVFAELRPLAQELDVTLSAEMGHVLVQVDGEIIERVLLNLVDNALKFSPGERTVNVRVHTPGTGGAPKGFVRVDVEDQGPGVPEEYRGRLFDRFVQIEGRQGKRRGTGLGLTFCRLAIQTHGGRVWIEDNPVGGSVFAFTLPVSKKLKSEG